jgi:CRISPR-associated endonuclease Csn1
LANPVVRKAIHEVRRHVAAYLRKFGAKPDRVIVELARDARLSGKVADRIAQDNRRRRDERETIKEEFAEVLRGKSEKQIAQAVERAILCRAQREACAYSDLDGQKARHIDPLQAAEGTGLEVDHVIPRSRGGGNGRGNKVLCYAATNRGKGNQTPKEWLSQEQFANLEVRFCHWKDGSKEDRMRWNNLHKDAMDMECYLQSQLTDTAYASRQVTQWLDQVLYGGSPVNDETKRHVFTTNGRYTSILRRQWGLFFEEGRPDPGQKSRADHRHHAIDAVVIACSGPERIGQIAAAWQTQENEWGAGKQPTQFTIAPPWGTHESFRRQVLDLIGDHIVSHRPERRKIVGQFHKDKMYGPILSPDGQLTTEFTKRISVSELDPNHLRVPQHWDTLREKLDQAETKVQKDDLRRQMLNMKDVRPAKSGVVRDRWFREELRQCLRSGGLDPDMFAKRQIMALILAGKMKLPGGRLVKKVTLSEVFNNTVQIPRHIPDMLTNRQRVIDPNPQSTRVYEAQSNHHVEIRENAKGLWVGRVVITFTAASRVRPPGRSGPGRPPAVDRTDNDEGRFIMSLAVGEMVRMAHPDTGRTGYFVVFKLDNARQVIHFTPHWDAGKSKEDENHRRREEIAKAPADLQKLRVDGQAPQKVWVGPLGDVRPYLRD